MDKFVGCPCNGCPNALFCANLCAEYEDWEVVAFPILFVDADLCAWEAQESS